MSDQQQTPEPNQTSDAPQLPLPGFLRIVRTIFAVLAAQQATSPIAESYERMHREAGAQLRALEAQLDQLSDEIAQRFDRQLELDCMQYWN